MIIIFSSYFVLRFKYSVIEMLKSSSIIEFLKLYNEYYLRRKLILHIPTLEIKYKIAEWCCSL